MLEDLLLAELRRSVTTREGVPAAETTADLRRRLRRLQDDLRRVGTPGSL
ncbi:hypothetical protein [Paractinoplanes atraurantiacus]|nr:hypothetical protein [Actinoplanes atraurantiacus]